MSDQSEKAQQNLQKRLSGLDPLQKQIVLLKLTDLYENRADNIGQYQVSPGSPEREWLSRVGAAIKQYDRIQYGSQFDTKMLLLNTGTAGEIVGLAYDVIEAIKLELELEGRDQIGASYAPGEHYNYFRDLRNIIGEARSEIFVVDPYFNGEAFDLYLSGVRDARIKILADRYTSDAKAYAEKHSAQYGTSIELRKSNELHDRLIFVDDEDCWITGGSIKDAGKKAAFLIPVAPPIAEAKRGIYSEIWSRASA